MATKKAPTRERPKAKPVARAAQPQKPTRLQNLAARPASFDDEDESMLVDNSGVFRVTSAITQAQTGHDEETTKRFPSESLVMAAQRDGFREDGSTMVDVLDETRVVDEAAQAERKARLTTLAARAQAVKNRTRR